jgi:hypothetical protein
MKNLQTFEGFINESIAIQNIETEANEIIATINEAKTVITAAQAKEIKAGVEKAIDGMKETPGIDDKTKVNAVKTGIGLLVITSIGDKLGDREASPEAKQRVKEFMLKVNMAKSLEEVQKVIFDVVDYALEIAQNTNK